MGWWPATVISSNQAGSMTITTTTTTMTTTSTGKTATTTTATASTATASTGKASTAKATTAMRGKCGKQKRGRRRGCRYGCVRCGCGGGRPRPRLRLRRRQGKGGLFRTSLPRNGTGLKGAGPEVAVATLVGRRGHERPSWLAALLRLPPLHPRSRHPHASPPPPSSPPPAPPPPARHLRPRQRASCRKYLDRWDLLVS